MSGTALRHRTSSGRIVDVEVSQHQIDFGGQAAELTIVTDVTGRRQLEEQLRQAQKMEAVGMLAGGVAHDFNNLLTIISGYSQLIMNTLQPGDPNHYAAEQILKAGERAATLTQQLLAFSRRQVLQPRVLDLNKLVTSLGTMLRRLIGEDIDLRLQLRPDSGRVNADPGPDRTGAHEPGGQRARRHARRAALSRSRPRNVVLDESYVGRHLAVEARTVRPARRE